MNDSFKQNMKFLLYFRCKQNLQPICTAYHRRRPEIYKEVYWNFKPLMSRCYISGFVSLFLILIWSTVGQIVIVSGHFIEVWCVPSATCGSWLYQIKNSVLRIGGFVELIFNFLYYFNSLYYALYVCYVYSRNPIAVSPYVLPFLWVKVE